MPYDLASLSLWNSSSSLCANISSGVGESLKIWYHMIITIPAELWGLITHILVYLWGLLLAGGMTEKEIVNLCYLSTFAWIFPTISAVHFLAFAFLAITFWSKECVITGIEGLMSSGFVTDVTGTLFRMRNTVFWTVCMNILLARLCTQHRHLVFPPQYEDSPTRLRTFWTNLIIMVWPISWLSALFPWFLLAPFWFGFRLFPAKLPLRCPPEAYIAM